MKLLKIRNLSRGWKISNVNLLLIKLFNKIRNRMILNDTKNKLLAGCKYDVAYNSLLSSPSYLRHIYVCDFNVN